VLFFPEPLQAARLSTAKVVSADDFG